MSSELATRKPVTCGFARAIWRQVGLSLVASAAALAQRVVVADQRKPAVAQNIYRLTGLDSAGWYSNAKKQYVVLRAAPVAVHKVQRWGSVLLDGQAQVPITMELYSLLVPAATARGLVPTLARQADWPLRAGDTLLINFSLLPTSEGAPRWQPMQPDTLPAGRRLAWAAVVGDGARRLARRALASRRHDHMLFTRGNLVPVVWRQGQYWAPTSFVLTQYFLVRSRRTRSLAPADYATINVQGPAVSFDAPWRELRALLPAAIDYPWSRALPFGIVREATQQGLVHFWSRPIVWITDVGEMQFYGLHRFAYKPGIGVLSGAYQDFDAEQVLRNGHFFAYKNMLFYNHIKYTRALIDDKTPIKE